jgi:3-oxoacyl-[acyl-carrier-protein] synthase II
MTVADQRRVVVTGMGIISPIGHGVDGLRAGLRARKSAVRIVDSFDTSPFVTHIGAPIGDFNVAEYLDAKQIKRFDRYSQFALSSAKMAVADSGLDMESLDKDRFGVCVGTAIGGVGFAEEQFTHFLKEGVRAVNPMLALSVFAGAASCNIAIEYGLCGPSSANGDSCASAPIALGRAYEYIKNGTTDIMLAGGAEATMQVLCFGAFALVRAMSRRNDDPATASRPFDKDRDGFVISEGAAMLVLEEYGRAKARGARIYGEILGHASTNDGNHMTQPRPDGVQAARCIDGALRMAHVEPSEIGYINAHGSSTILNDVTEIVAIKKALGDAAYHIPISGTKGYHGHALGASGAWEAAITLLSIYDNWLPPTVNLFNPDPACDLDLIRGDGREVKIEHALSNSFGFGGINACLVFGRV